MSKILLDELTSYTTGKHFIFNSASQGFQSDFDYDFVFSNIEISPYQNIICLKNREQKVIFRNVSHVNYRKIHKNCGEVIDIFCLSPNGFKEIKVFTIILQ